MTDVWVCTNCKSINRQRDTRCYSCGNRKDEVAAPEEQAPTDRFEQAIAYRARRGYSPSWPLGLIAAVLILVVAAIGVYIVVEQYAQLEPLKRAVAAAFTQQQSTELQRLVDSASESPAQQWRFPVLLLALLAFGAWLARICINIPLLGGGMPTWTPVRAFVFPAIPILNLFTVPRYVGDAMYRLDPSGGGFFMILAALLALVGSFVVSVIGSIVIVAGTVGQLVSASTIEEATAVFTGMIDQIFGLALITATITAVGALLLAVIIWRVERRAGARNAEIEARILTDPRFNPPVAARTVPVAAPSAPSAPAAPYAGIALDDAPLSATAPSVPPAATAAPVAAAATLEAVPPAEPPAPEVPPEPSPVVDAASAPLTTMSPGSAASSESGHQPHAGVPIYRPTFETAPAPTAAPASAPAENPSPPPAAPDPAPADDAGPMLPPPPPPA